MPNNQFFEKKGPFPLKDIVKTLGCASDINIDDNFKIYGIESLDNANKNDMTFLNSHKYKDLSLKTEAAACITSHLLCMTRCESSPAAMPSQLLCYPSCNAILASMPSQLLCHPS